MKRSDLLYASLLLSPALILLFAAAPLVPAAELTTDSLETIEKNLGDRRAILVDVREVSETNKGYIDGAILVPLSLLQEGSRDEQFGEVLAQRLPKKAIVYLYCGAGVRCRTAADVLVRLGYEARPLKHGFADLAREGFVTAKPKN
jgi:rhodanese-related sulfurtransferase